MGILLTEITEVSVSSVHLLETVWTLVTFNNQENTKNADDDKSKN